MTANWSNTNGTTNTRSGSVHQVTVDVIRYVNDTPTGNRGWLVMKDSSNNSESIHKYTKLMLIGSKGGRTFFKVMEGTNNGKTLYLSDANVPLYIGTKAPQHVSLDVVVTYGNYDSNWVSAPRGGQVLKQQLATLSVVGISAQVTMNSVWKEDLGWKDYYPIDPGTYKILLPNAPHKANMTSFYRRAVPGLKNDQVWFPIQFGDNSRFVHIGHVSEGCTTVVDLGKWDSIHEALISHRAADGVSVGNLIVKGKRQRAK